MKNNEKIDLSDRKRLIIISFGIFFLFSLLIWQYFKIQVIEGEKWSKLARKQHFFVVEEPFQRGRFISNTSIKQGHPEIPEYFVVDIRKFHLYIDPMSIPEEHHDAIANYLLANLSLSIEEKSHLNDQFKYQSRSRKLAMWLDMETQEKILEWWHPFARANKIPRNALYFVADYQRSYPFGKMLGQVLQTVQHNKDEITKQGIPTGGLELQFNKYLQGKPGKRQLLRSPRHSFESGSVITLAENGADVYLTVNHCLQAIVEEELANGIKASQAKGGWAIMMNPHTGEILAIAQYPFFNPEEYAQYFNDKELLDHTRPKVITDAYEPGSVMKTFTFATGLVANEELRKAGKKELFDPEEKMATSNGKFPGRRKDLKDTHLHYFLNMNMALLKSSNIYPARIVERIINTLGDEWYRSTLTNVFGFSQKTGIELPSETPGVLPQPGKLHPNGKPEWSTPTPFSMAMGHSIQVTAMQLIRGYAIFANGGYLVKPTLLRKIVKKQPDGTQVILLDNTSPERVKQFPRVLSSEIVDRMVCALKYVTKLGGTGRRADVYGYTDAGKTGTANKSSGGTYSETNYLASFIGFTPVDHPAFVLLITLDEPKYGYIAGLGKNHHGGVASGTIFRAIAQRSLAYLGISPDDPHGYPVGDPRYDKNKADWVLEAQRLQEMYEKWNNSSHEAKKTN